MDEQYSLLPVCGIILLWVMLCCLVMLSADKQGKSPLVWLLLSIVLTPLFAYIVLLALQNKPPMKVDKTKG